MEVEFAKFAVLLVRDPVESVPTVAVLAYRFVLDAVVANDVVVVAFVTGIVSRRRKLGLAGLILGGVGGIVVVVGFFLYGSPQSVVNPALPSPPAQSPQR